MEKQDRILEPDFSLSSQEEQVLQEIRRYASDGNVFSFEDLVLYSDFDCFQLTKVLVSLNEKKVIEYSAENKYGLIIKEG